ncbi:hypothetical protein ACLB2K_042651 [Fragaria x ananassa]
MATFSNLAYFPVTNKFSSNRASYDPNKKSLNNIEMNGTITKYSTTKVEMESTLTSFTSVTENGYISEQQVRQNISITKQSVDHYRQGMIIEGGVGYRQRVVIRSYEVGPDTTATTESIVNLLQAGFDIGWSVECRDCSLAGKYCVYGPKASDTRPIIFQCQKEYHEITRFEGNLIIAGIVVGVTPPRSLGLVFGIDSTSLPFSTASSSVATIPSKDIVVSFKQWFKSGHNLFLHQIFQILKATDDADRFRDSSYDVSFHHRADLALSHLDLRLTEALVLEVLHYGSEKEHDVLSCLKFFDGVGRQRSFRHTRATFNTIFKILSRTMLMSLIHDFLSSFSSNRYDHSVRFHDMLVMGYAVSGKPEVALQMLGKMRFQGLDLDNFGYHVLLNSLVEENCFDAVHVIAQQIALKGFKNDITHSIMLKWLCKQNRLDEADEYLRRLVSEGKANGSQVGVLVRVLCQHKNFKHAGTLMNEFHDLESTLSTLAVWRTCQSAIGTSPSGSVIRVKRVRDTRQLTEAVIVVYCKVDYIGKSDWRSSAEQRRCSCGYKRRNRPNTGLLKILQILELEEPIAQMKIIHVAGTKGNEKASDDIPMPTYIRFLALLAFKIFSGENVDVAILEAGLGGKFDATNVQAPVVCGISSLGYDHMEILGYTLGAIAGEKARIFKVPLQTVPLVNTNLLNGLKLGLEGEHQYVNAGLAVALCSTWLQRIGHLGITHPENTTSLPEQFIKGLTATVNLQGRAQIVPNDYTNNDSPGDLTFYLDGSYSPESMEICARWFLQSHADVKAKKNSQVNTLLILS